MRREDCPQLPAPKKDTRPLATCPLCAWCMRTSDRDRSERVHRETAHKEAS